MVDTEIRKKLFEKYYDSHYSESLFSEVIELSTIKTNKVETIMLSEFDSNDESSYSGYYQIKIEIRNKNNNDVGKDIEIPLDWINIKEEELIKQKIEEKASEYINLEDNEIVLALNSAKYFLVLVPTDDCFLIINLGESNRQVNNFKIDLSFIHNRTSKEEIKEKLKKIIIKYLTWQFQQKKNEYSEYPKYLDNKFQPFQKYLEAERKSITRDEFKPKAIYVNIEIIKGVKNSNKIFAEERININNNGIKDFEVLNIDDKLSDDRATIYFDDLIPKQLTEPKNKIKVIWGEYSNILESPDEIHQKQAKSEFVTVSIEDWDEEEFALIFSKKKAVEALLKAGKKGIIQLQENLTNHRRKQKALDLLRQPYLTPLQNLSDMMLRPEVFSPLTTKKVLTFDSRIGEHKIETKNQYLALEKITHSNDLTIIQGPPGSGKTTLIVELVKQAISKEERILMCAPTHVAVDNILEMLDKNPDMRLQIVRVGRSYRVQEDLKKYLLSELEKSWDQFIIKNLHNKKNNYEKLDEFPTLNNKILEINNYFLSNIKKSSRLIKDMIINTSNLVCGTSTGIVAIYGQNNYIEDFDLMIIDESSKATILEFLIAATRAKRWVIIGDQNQLSPYIEDREIRIFFDTYFNKAFDKEEIIELNKYARRRLEKMYRFESADWKMSEEIKVHDFVKLLMILFRTIYEGTHFIQNKTYIKREWDEILRLFNNKRKRILNFAQLIEILGSCYHYFFKRLYNIDKSRFQMLNYQYRMPPLICDFISNTFYSGELKYSSEAKNHGLRIETNLIMPNSSLKNFSVFTFLSTENYHDILKTDRRRGRSTSWFNILESEIVVLLLKQIYHSFKENKFNNLWLIESKEHPIFNKDNPLTVGIITFYASQFGDIIRRVKKLDFIKQSYGSFFEFKDMDVQIQISIVDRFQGREKDIIIIPMTRSNNYGNIGFLKSRQRANVAFSRAKHNLFIIGNKNFFKNLHHKYENEPYIELIKYCSKSNLIFELSPNQEIIDQLKLQLKPEERNFLEKNSLKTSEVKTMILKPSNKIDNSKPRKTVIKDQFINQKKKRNRIIKEKKTISSHTFKFKKSNSIDNN